MGLLDGLFKPSVYRLISNLKCKSYKDLPRAMKAVKALGNLKDIRAIEALINVLKEDTEYTNPLKRGAVEALVRIGEPAVEPLIQALEDAIKDSNLMFKIHATDVLSKIGGSAVEPLIQILKDKDTNLVVCAVETLGKIGDEKAAEPLIKILAETEFGLYTVIKALNEIPSTSIDDSLIAYYRIARNEWGELPALGEMAVEALICALRGRNIIISMNAAEALGKIGSEKAVEPLILSLGDDDWKVREKVVEALGKIRSEEDLEPLIGVLKDEHVEVRKSAVEALRKIGSEKAVEPLILSLGDDDWKVREKVVEALGWIEPEKALKPLISSLDDDHSEVREKAVEVLGNIESEEALEPLMGALKDESYAIRLKALNILREKEDKRSAGAVIDFIFDNPKGYGGWNVSSFYTLFADYSNLIFKTANYSVSSQRYGSESYSMKYTYNLDDCEKALSELCKINSPVANNLLHKVANKKDKRVTLVHFDSRDSRDGAKDIIDILSFSSLRKTARAELKKRGNPAYDPSAYLDEQAWKI